MNPQPRPLQSGDNNQNLHEVGLPIPRSSKEDEQKKRLREKQFALAGKSFRTLKMIGSIMGVAEKVAGATSYVPVVGLIAASLVGLCDILRFALQCHYRKKYGMNGINPHAVGANKALRFRGAKMGWSTAKLGLHIAKALAATFAPTIGAILLFTELFSSLHTRIDDTCKFRQKLKAGTATPSERAAYGVKTGSFIFAAAACIVAFVAILLPPLAPVLNMTAAALKAADTLSYSSCSIGKAAANLAAEKKKQKAIANAPVVVGMPVNPPVVIGTRVNSIFNTPPANNRSRQAGCRV